jgi:cystathionine beta-lyase
LPEDPGHALWRRDCRGGNGLLSFSLTAEGEAAAAAVVDALRLFGIGASWGGYESLATYGDLSQIRSLGPVASRPEFLIRLHIGLEAPEDLIADLDQALATVRDVHQLSEPGP